MVMIPCIVTCGSCGKPYDANTGGLDCLDCFPEDRPLYIQECLNPKCPEHVDYGGKLGVSGFLYGSGCNVCPICGTDNRERYNTNGYKDDMESST